MEYPPCNEALETKIHAIMKGVSLTIQRSNLPVQLQSDYTVALATLANGSLDKSAYGYLLT